VTSIDRQEVPRLLRGALYALLVVAGVASLPFIGAYGPLPTTTLLDAWMIIFIVTCFVRGRTQHAVLFLLLVGYLLTRVIPAVAISAPVTDFLQAYRWILYLIAFALAVGRPWGRIKPVIGVTWALLSMALAKAAATYVFLGPGERPGLLLENNFELALFSGLLAIVYTHLGRGKFWAIAMLGALTVLAGSRSGAIAFVILAVYAVFQARNANLLVKYVLFCAIPAVGFVAVSIFESREQVGRPVDRLNFLDVFLIETRDWTPLTWLFGTTPITPLSDVACARLSYFQLLFASTNDGTCYSVILHAFVLRVLFDAGIVGLLIAFAVTLFTLRKGGVAWGLTGTLALIAFSNGFSVSGLNNPYVALPILLAIVLAARSGYDPDHVADADRPSRQVVRHPR
jgi:hypothetical protein